MLTLYQKARNSGFGMKTGSATGNKQVPVDNIFKLLNDGSTTWLSLTLPLPAFVTDNLPAPTTVLIAMRTFLVLKPALVQGPRLPHLELVHGYCH